MGNIQQVLSGGLNQIELLWENPNPTVPFEGSEIFVSAAEYRFLLVCTQITNVIVAMQPPALGVPVYLQYTDLSGSQTYCFYRSVIPYTDRVVIDVGVGRVLPAGTNYINNAALIPLLVYGIR